MSVYFIVLFVNMIYNIYNNGVNADHSTKNRERKISMIKTKKLLSLFTSVAMAASTFSAIVIPASAEDIEVQSDNSEAAVYVNEAFDYEDQQIIASAGKDVVSAPDPVTLGDIAYTAGRRNNGPINDKASIASGALVISADSLATNSRGIAFSFDSALGIPAVSELDADKVLELSMDISANQAFELTGFGQITTENLGTTTDTVHLRVIIDKAHSKQYIIACDPQDDAKVLASSVAPLTANGFTGATFYVGAGTFTIDNLKVETKAADVGVVEVSVKNGDNGIDDAIVNVAGTDLKTGSDGLVTIALPNGEYTVTASKSGYEHTKGMMDNDSVNVTVNSDIVNADLTLSPMSYDKLPETVTINDGQNFIAAPKTAEPNKTAAFTVEVLDQYDILVEPEEYTLTWAIYPAGTKTADANVTIDGNGVVSVAQAFSAAGNIAEYDVTATAVMNNEGLRGQTVTKTLVIGNNDVIYYEPIAWVQANGTRNGSASIASAVTLPKLSAITLNMSLNYTEGQRTMALTTNAGALVGLQLVGTTIKAWTGWTGNSAYNQSGDVDKFTNSAVLMDDYATGTALDFTFTIDTDAKNITVSTAAGEKTYTVSVPYTINPTTFTGFTGGQYRTYGGMAINTVMVQEPDADYLSITGDADFAKISGTNVTRQYALSQSVIVPDETFTWTVSKNGETLSTAEESASYAAVLTPKESGSAVVIKAVYDEKGKIVSVVPGETITVTAGEAVTIPANKGEKVMLWDSITGMKAMANAALAAVVETPPTTPPTEPTTPPVGDAVTINADGVLTVKDTAEPGTYKISVVSSVNPNKKAELDVEIGNFQEITAANAVVEGPRAFANIGDTATYEITKLVDSYGDDVTELLPAAVWSSTNTDVAEINASTGELRVKATGEIVVKATITNGTAVTTLEVPVTVAKYYITADATGDTTAVDTSALISDGAVTGYQVTTSNGGKLVSKTVVNSAPTSVDTTGADRLEIAPVFEYSNITKANSVTAIIPADTYNFDISNASGAHFDPYVNDQMLANNMLQGGSYAARIAVNDIVVNEGYATLNIRDAADNSKAGKITIVKSPSIVDRTKKVYVLGDSLVCIYDNGGSEVNNTYQTGWGQVLQNYIKDAEVVDLGNSGVTAPGLAGSAITQVAISGKPGDIMLLESGYNDRTYVTQAAMTEAVTFMYNQAKAANVEPVLISPNASQHDYKAGPAWAGHMMSIADSLGSKKIDLGTLSYNFLYGTYGDNTEAVKATYNVSDGLHSQYRGAQKLASIVAGAMIDLGMGDNVNTEYKYTFTDTLGNTIECQAAATAAE